MQRRWWTQIKSTVWIVDVKCWSISVGGFPHWVLKPPKVSPTTDICADHSVKTSTPGDKRSAAIYTFTTQTERDLTRVTNPNLGVIILYKINIHQNLYTIWCLCENLYLDFWLHLYSTVAPAHDGAPAVCQMEITRRFFEWQKMKYW